MNIPEDISRDITLLAVGGVLGFLASALASIAFSIGMRFLRPDIDISAEIALDGGIHKIKLVNKRRRNAVDLDVRVWVLKRSLAPGGGKKYNQQLKPVDTKFRHPILLGKNRATKKDGRGRFARLVRFEDTFRETWSNEGEHNTILVVVFARDEVSGVGQTFEAEYGDPTTFIKTGYFAHGDSMSIVSR